MEERFSLGTEVEDKIQRWLKHPFDLQTQKEIKHLRKTDPQKLFDAFYTDLSFGTAGLRGLMGVGSNRINRYTIARATQGLANYLLKIHPQNSLKVAIAYDSRHGSELFAQEAARVLAGNGIAVLLSYKLRPTPFLSFICRHHRCAAGIMITASHNPPEYNGYKIYWSDGGQVVSPHDQGIMDEVNKVSDIEAVYTADLSDSLIEYLTPSDDRAYIETLTALQNLPQETSVNGALLSVVFSNLHGTGITLLPDALNSWGFTTLHHVEKQKLPSPDFPTVTSPNPELKDALQLGIDTLLRVHGDLLLATDPDADRVGVVSLHKNTPVVFNGNQIATLCLYHLLTTLDKQKRLTPQHTVISTIVTTPLLQTLCNHYHITYMETLTGFKYIGEKMREFESAPTKNTFLFGAEESYGYLYGTHVHDKDAIIASCLLCELALEQKKQGLSLLDLLYTIYQRFGVYQEDQLSISLPDEEKSQRKIAEALARLRATPPQRLCEQKVISVSDYSLSAKTDLVTNTTSLLSLPKSNVLTYDCEDGSRFVIRPSGTEPKLKIYGMIRQDCEESVATTMDMCHDLLVDRLQTIRKSLLRL